MESINTFSNGMSSDLSKQVQSKDTYLQALNFRALTEAGGSNGALVNIKGNQCAITFPDLQAVYKLQLIKGTDVAPNDTKNVATITINSTTVGTLEISNSTQGIDLYNYIIKNYPNCYQYTGTTVATKTFSVAYEDDYVVFYSQPVYSGCSPVASVPTIISISYSASTGGTKAVFKFINSDKVSPSLTQNTTKPYVSKVLSDDIIPIGSTFILNDIYILTAPDNPIYGPADIDNEIPSNDQFKYGGAIWKLNINDVTKDSTLTLIYSNNIDFTKYHPIAPSAITGRYESTSTQRIYWTDFYNSIRSLLVTDPQIMALNPALLSIFPSVTFELPILNSFTGGSLAAGTYELSYRLKKSGGAVSNFSQTSNMINLLGNESDITTAGYVAYEGPTSTSSNTNRGIVWDIYNIDIAWDTIEFIILYRSTKTALPVIYKTLSQNIGTTSPYTFTLNTVTELEEILLEDFLNISSGFTHAKTVDTKDNRLFWGNVKAIKQKEITTLFDARAFRSKTANTEDIYLINNGIIGLPIDLDTAIATPKINDSINPYYDSNGDVDSNACYYKPGTSKLGGAGANISYEFGTESIYISDLAVTQGGSGDYYINAPSTGVPYSYRTSGVTTSMGTSVDLILGSTDSDNQVYPLPSASIGTSKNPYITSVMKGFQPEEIYRFAIQFFDLQGLPYFSEWIGDIKMPSYDDYNDNPNTHAVANGITDFRASYLAASNNNIFGQTLYIKFTIDVSLVANYISGYQIVRVERTDENKTILGHGMLTNVFVDTALVTEATIPGGLWLDKQWYPSVTNPIPPYVNEGIPYDPYPDYDTNVTLSQDATFNLAATSDRMLTYDSFDFLSKGYSFRDGDKVLIRSRVEPINWVNAKNGVGNPRFRTGFANQSHWLTNPAKIGSPITYVAPGFGGGKFRTGYDSEESPINMLFYSDVEMFHVDKPIKKGVYVVDGGKSLTADNGLIDFWNYQRSFGTVTNSETYVPGEGAATTLLVFDSLNKIPSNATPYNANTTNGGKLMALYYRPNINQYGGNTYSARTNSVYIACGSFIPLNRKNIILNNNKNITFKTFGGDIFVNFWDHQKVIKSSTGVELKMYPYDGSGNPGNLLGNTISPQFRNNNIFFIPCNNTNNQAVRYGYHTDTQLTTNTLVYPGAIDKYNYQSYHSNEKNVVTFFPKPLGFIVNDEWRNRVFFSEIKFDNEIEDSWSKYLPNSFYDVEGNYGQIMALISLKENMYYLQERGIGLLMINPVSMVSDSAGQNVKLGSSSKVIEKHYYRAIDTGTSHQWSVYRSQSTISFVDVRHKKIYLFNGESVTPISDIKGQRNFVIKRFHDTPLVFDNPIINKGVLTTYDYYHNEFLYTFLNVPDTNQEKLTKQEKLTLAYSEVLSVFTGMYNFTPNMYINSNKYLLSTISDNKVWLHNYGTYGNFYGTQYPCTLKILFNEQPMYTKVLDNLTWMSEAVNDNNLWNDDFNIYPGSPSEPALSGISYPDDVNKPFETFNKIRVYNQYQNTDWTTLTLAPPTNNLRKVEQGFNLQVPRNKFNYNTAVPSITSLFVPANLNKVIFGERIRDKWAIIDLHYNNVSNVRFIIHNIKSIFRVSDR